LRRVPVRVPRIIILVALIPLLPLIWPITLASFALEMRRLARTRCAHCGAAIGHPAIRRAREEAADRGRAIVAATLARGVMPRVVVNWEVTCPACGQGYVYAHDMQPRPELVAKATPGS